MDCPNCGERLQWDDGAFCARCMKAAFFKKELAKKQKEMDDKEAWRTRFESQMVSPEEAQQKETE